MIDRLLSVSVIFLAIALSACAPMQRAPVGTSTPLPTEAEQTERPPASTEEPVIQSEERAAQPVTNPAVTSLVNQGWRHLQQDNYEAALSVAERAQRIDPRSPEVYLLMANAQFSLYQLSVAEQLTRRGLSFAQSGSAVSRQLQSLLQKITASR
jgi:tetratricopeptide (TPR) repeat protein